MKANAVERLAVINAAREVARAKHPDLVAFLEQARADFPGGGGHFYPNGERPCVSVNMEQMAEAGRWEAMLRKRRQKELVKRKMIEQNIK